MCEMPGTVSVNELYLLYTSVQFSSVQFSSVAQFCPTLYDHMNCSTLGLPVHHHLPQFIQTYVHQVGDVILPSHPLLSPSPPAPNPSQQESSPTPQFKSISSSVLSMAKFIPVWPQVRYLL